MPGLVLKIDGEEKAEALWASGIVVDPGTRILEASAPRKKTATSKVKIDDEGVVQQVALTPLDDAAAVVVVGPQANTADLASLEQYASNRARRTTGYLVGGLGLAVLATGVVFGVVAIVNNNEAKSRGAPCYRDQPAGNASDQATDRSLVFANIANVTVPLGLIGAGLGTYCSHPAGPTKKIALAAEGLRASRGSRRERGMVRP